ncbi:phosphatase PAP2 family protein [Psychromicrobium lacuslunae]|uniref:phosphatase PAP2 family protein n=1 Tax=Psychromicrobium lacuslunae TaxID=1618207 RepID=UPI0009E4DC43|nr:phosphatase PAP2 family protein [Psychromicrobium lacuslunae]
MRSLQFSAWPIDRSRGLLILSGTLVLLGIAGFIAVYSMVHTGGGLASLDRLAFQDLLRQRSRGWTIFFAVISTLGSPPWLASIVLISAGLWLLISRDWWRPMLWVAAMALGAATSNIIKHLVGRRRPPLVDMATGANHSFSFPSGHTLGISIFILALGYLLLSRKFSRLKLLLWIVSAALLISLMALSRMYLGYHWLTDISASIPIAVFFLGVLIAVDVFRPRRADVPLRKSSKPAAESIDRQPPPQETPDQR